MDKKKLEAFACEAAKGLKAEKDLAEFSQMLTKVTVEAALNAELDQHLGYERHQSSGNANSRKNYLFLGSDAGAERAATLYSLLGTAKLNGINPDACLRHVLSVMADYPVNRIDELLPWRSR